MAAVLVVALAIGAQRPGPVTAAQRAHHIATQVRCPECREQSAADSDAAAARAVRDEILRRVRAGQSDSEIRAFLVSRYGRDILLKPPGTGIAGLVWALPVAGLVVAVVALAATFRRWRSRSGRAPTDDDRARVAEALRG